MATRDSSGILIFDWDDSGKIAIAKFDGGTLPTDENKFAPGCVLISNSAKVYSNQATSGAADFQNMNVITPGELAPDFGVSESFTTDEGEFTITNGIITAFTPAE